MTRPRHRANVAARRRGWVLPAIGIALAVALAPSLGGGSAHALWVAFSPFRAAAIRAGQPILNLTGLEGDDGLDHQYEADALVKVGTVRLENVGDVALTGFSALRELSEESTLPLHSDAFEWTFTRAGAAAAATDWDGWVSQLGALTLGPADVAEYTLSTALRDPASLSTLAQKSAESTVYVTAMAANHGTHTPTNWSITTGGGFGQSIGEAPPVGHYPENAGWFLSNATEQPPYHGLHFVITAFPSGFDPQSVVTIHAVNGATEVSLGGWGSFYYHPYFPIAGNALLGAVPDAGPKLIWIEARVNGSVIARAPLWVVRTGSTVEVWGEIPPPQGLSAIAFSSPAARSEAAPAPESTAGPSVTAEETPAPDPTQTPPPRPPTPPETEAPAEEAEEAPATEPPAAAPTEPDEPPAATPDEPDESPAVSEDVSALTIVVGKDEQDEQTIEVSWNDSAAGTGTVFRVKLDDEQLEESYTERTVALTADRIPEALKPAPGSAVGIDVTIVDEAGDPVARGRFWVTADTDGVLTMLAEDPAGQASD